MVADVVAWLVTPTGIRTVLTIVALILAVALYESERERVR